MDILSIIITAIVSALVASGAVWAALNKYGERWLQSIFDKRLAAFKHDNEKELEQVRRRLNAVFDREVRLHEKEFEVAPEMWGRMRDAFDRMRIFCAWMQAVPPVNEMKPAQLEDFLSVQPLREWQKDELRKATNKLDYFVKAMFHHELADIKKVYYGFSGYHMKNGIFLSRDIDIKFMALRDIIYDAMKEKELFEQMRHYGAADPTKRPALDALNAAEPTVEKMRVTVRALLRDSKQDEAPSLVG